MNNKIDLKPKKNLGGGVVKFHFAPTFVLIFVSSLGQMTQKVKLIYFWDFGG